MTGFLLIVVGVFEGVLFIDFGRRFRTVFLQVIWNVFFLFIKFKELK